MKWFKWQSKKDKEIEKLNARIAELEEQLKHAKRRRNNKRSSKA